jgi:hypothetical protein
MKTKEEVQEALRLVQKHNPHLDDDQELRLMAAMATTVLWWVTEHPEGEGFQSLLDVLKNGETAAKN